MKKDQNKQAQWRKEIAKKLISKIKNKSNLVSFFIGGSVARNLADEYSDLEICFVWKAVISENERKQLYKLLAFSNINLTKVQDPTEPFEDTVYLKELQIDIWHLTDKKLLESVEDVTVNLETNLSKLNLLETIQSCIPLYGEKYIQDLQEKISYPNTLAVKIISKYTKDFFKADMEIYIERKDWIIVYRFITSYLRLNFVVLEAINRKFHLGFKRMNKSLEKLEILPKDIHNIYSNLNNLAPNDAWKELCRIKNETIALIKIHYPSIDLKFIQENKKVKRTKIVKL